MQRNVNVYAVIVFAMLAVALFAGWTSWSGYRLSGTPPQIQVLLDALRWFVITQALMTLLVLATLGGIYRLLRGRDQREAASRAAMASAHAEVLHSREQMQRLNDRQNAMLAMSRKVQSAIGVEQFSQVLLAELCTACDATVGMVWLNRGKVGLRCVASRCISGMGGSTGGRQLELDEGEGMVGQVAASGRMTSYAVPPGYLHIESGSLSLVPACTILLPVRYQDETVAVFEFALLAPPDADKLGFVREMLESMAVRYFMFSSRENPDSVPLSVRRTLAATA
ncbi:MAG: hypothetical protein Q7T32_05295 [Moraxellaceae bacterium]|nr:hypothetical protein [Moraxellaceae bacterium]